MATSTILLGIECGGTRTVALAATTGGSLQLRKEAGPANLRLLDDRKLEGLFRSLASQLPSPAAIGVGMAGVRDRKDCARVEGVLSRVWPGVPHRVDHDLESALAAAEPDPGRKPRSPAPDARVIILSGTGSCCYGRNRRGQTAKVGGWGHLLGDRGSAYDIAFRALREAAHEFDHFQTWSRFGQQVLRALSLNEPNALIAWLQSAGKTEVAALAPEVFSAASLGDRGARRVLAETARILAEDALACARHLHPRGGTVEFALAGSVLLRQKGLAAAVARRIRSERPGSTIRPLPRESVWGAVAMAREALNVTARVTPPPQPSPPGRKSGRTASTRAWVPTSRELSPTERRNPRSATLDRMSLRQAITLALEEEGRIPGILKDHTATVERLIGLSVRSLKSGGRLFYVGAGTSGRLGVLDASECPPTFRSPPELIQGVIAGGFSALHSAVEGAEDDFDAGAQVMAHRGVGAQDLVIGIAASGRTPFVWGALTAARQRGARTALLCFNPHLDFRGGWKPDVILAPDLGPEILTGSTRLKAGTATKLILNLITTLAMVRLGKVVGNLMVDLNPSNVKLRDRAVRILQDLTGTSAEAAQTALVRTRWQVPEALRLLLRLAQKGDVQSPPAVAGIPQPG
ncbi:MAG: N-acetylmuramic acid 6-phosphate etherase [Verrucomicrobiales bacterium]|nr:N-acetylmuramic acid 6-phosphate etherase [Verrucomicrobiales bacterium]